MAFSATQLTALEEAIASGVLTVDYGDRRTTYRSLAEMRAVRDMMRQDLGYTAAAPKTVYTMTRSGF